MGWIRKWFYYFSPWFFFIRLLVDRCRGVKRFYIVWNRGLGDLPLGLYGLNHRIKEVIKDAQIIYITRQDLYEGFSMLPGCRAIVDPAMKRAQSHQLEKLPDDLKFRTINNPQPTRWLRHQIGRLMPRLELQGIHPDPIKTFIALHTDTETGAYYGYEKNWPVAHFQELIQRLNRHNIQPLIIGLKKTEDFSHLQVQDLRGELSIKEVLKVILERCAAVVAPDSGILSLLYYIDVDVPLKLISFWSDPRQGILKQRVPSPNQQLLHVPLVKNDLKQLSVDAIFFELNEIISKENYP